MNPRLASSMSALALLGLVWHLAPSSVGTSGEKSPAESAPTKSAASKQETAPLHLGPWVATCRFFGHDPAPTFCLNSGFKVKLMVATLPDPSKTRLGLFTDRAIASIQKGAQDAGWEFDSQWLPWKFAEGESGDKRWLAKDAKEAEPGILIFRESARQRAAQFPRRALFVFTVGETPTAGVDGPEMAKFFQYRDGIFNEVLNDKEPFDIAGPTFSGSLPSLAYALSQHRGEVKRVYSGSVTYGVYSDVFRRDVPGVDFQSATQESEKTTRELSRVGSRLGLKNTEIAILAEDETAFGGSFRLERERLSSDKEFVTIPFPREISSLRNATQVTATSTTNPAQPTSGGVPFSLRDADGGEDSVPLFGHSQTALSQYSTITRIVSLIRRGRFKLVEVAATNVLDALFLATVLHDGAPDTRILVRNTDLLFVRAAREQSLSGILAVSNYPPYLANPSFPNARNQVLLFPDGDSEGLYQAVYHLLESSHSGLRPSAAWLVEFTATGPWPVARFGPALREWEISSRLSRQWCICTVLALGLTCWLYGTFWFARDRQETRFDIFKIPLPPGSKSHILMHQSLAVFAIVCCLAVLSVLLIPALTLQVPDWWPVLPMACCVPLVLGFVTAFRWHLAEGLRLLVILLFAAVPAMIWVPLFHDDGPERGLMAVRYAEIASGCSGAVPIVLTVLGLLLAALLHMNRLSMVVYRDPGVPGRGLEKEAQASLNSFAEGTEAVLQDPGIGVMNARKAIPALAILVILGVLTRPTEHLSSVEGSAFTWLFFALALSLLLVIVWCTAGVLTIWKKLRGFLGELNRLPLGGAFRRLPRQFSGSAIWAGMPMSRTYITFFGSAECIGEFHSISTGLARQDPVVVRGAYAWQLQLNESGRQLRAWEKDGKLPDHETLVNQFQDCAEFLQEQFLGREWKRGRTDPDPGTETHDKPENLSPEDKAYRLAAKFVALRYAAWLRYVLRHIRNLLFVISGGYALLSMALLSLDYQSPQAIRWFLTVLFLAIVTPLVYCMMQMDRDAVLSRMSDTTVGELNKDFYVKAASYIGLPLVGVLSSQFPSFSRFIFSWMQPTLDVLK